MTLPVSGNNPEKSQEVAVNPTPRPPIFLMVDDNKDDCLRIHEALKIAVPNFVPICLHDYRSAIAYLSGTPPYSDRQKHPLPDVAVIDIDLGGQSGLELLVWIRQHPHLHTLPTVILSKSLWPNDRKTAELLGASAYYRKPSNLLELIATSKEIGRLVPTQ